MGFDPVSYAMGAKAGGGGGGASDTQFLAQINLRKNKTPKSLTVDAKNAGYVGIQGFSSDSDADTTLEHLTINDVDSANALSLYLLQCQALKRISVTGDPIIQRNNQMFSICINLQEIDAEIDFSRMAANSWYNTFANCRALQEVRIVPGSIKLTVANNNFQNCTALSDDSIVSISNGLDGSATGQSISLPSAITTRCGQIVGTVSDGLFVQDDTGSLTLTDFITQTKGWTLA